MKPLPNYFKITKNLESAFIHRSYCHDHPEVPSNERLEFLGDSILSAVISDRLYNLFPQLPEGELTGRRSHVVCTYSLAQKAKILGLDSQIKMSQGEEDSGGRLNPGLLANTFEAVLGALYLDSGFSACQIYLSDIFPNQELSEIIEFIKDPKSLLQEKTQSKGWGTPVYDIISAVGPDHSKLFTIQAIINGKPVATGTGSSKQRAETDAARASLAIIFP